LSENAFKVLMADLMAAEIAAPRAEVGFRSRAQQEHSLAATDRNDFNEARGGFEQVSHRQGCLRILSVQGGGDTAGWFAHREHGRDMAGREIHDDGSLR
jgi:hypothetical protein